MTEGPVFFDEMSGGADAARAPYQPYEAWFQNEDLRELRKKSIEAERFFRRTGITFNVYGQDEADERLIPFDIVPRIISGREWARLTKGIEQRVRAINAFLYDIYHRQEILRAGRVPKELIARNDAFLPQMIGVAPPGNIYTHIVGVDLVRTGEDEFYVLEDNARTPSGVSYMLENRETMLQMFPELFSRIKVREVQDYPVQLRRSLAACAPPAAAGGCTVAVLTPGIHNSAYFEHAFLADHMGVELVEGSDLRVIDGRIAMRTTQGYKPIDVLYRRVDDDFLDPLNFNPESMLGVPGIMDVYRAGGVTIANAPGTGIADDKAIYSYMPDIVEFYTGEKAILQNVPTHRCSEPDALAYVLDHLSELVVKEVHGSGGYGMLVGPAASKKELAAFRTKLEAKPGNYIAQPTLALSTVPILTQKGLAPRHVDLRPFVLVAPDRINITPGGLTRVALKKGSLVVNSSQGGGTKDTWVLEE
ncbi:circularly permuted type 2 ATP-grasp protein [Roseobacter sp. HKCCD9010]|uniref:circularly permuted type 2 ATP-grasp protein n=1 Tax=unclassified Roseobacter TaxID=196798 RepID=UPI001492FFEA|nr:MULTISPECIES: circularly permuted type 2 ATP-grasp protein [unclassified Roseobacter]MBF9049619.1 circularly permuted type 2 ATP-grasp protein [Rhodobacterales bacterium HKCCD4356]NNV11619.1 circularly permuted type 2 ATP-grasp protein [Roseobacter sp. HKCCD7357]NNV15803.1 circularly permuted type 2 ATP-grasp protein [Roseobacter sp. HKCCD8768]NNV25263.1 circularly permuted type 2 ATP-grasp protein [Roseobacter sp. HKCCD8192]NNV29520.1 circularly permuted type 2 ATP-grasp protein [Roseobact